MILTNNVKLRNNRSVGTSTTSSKNIWGKPPSKPSMQSMLNESDVWFEIVQFWIGNGRPVFVCFTSNWKINNFILESTHVISL